MMITITTRAAKPPRDRHTKMAQTRLSHGPSSMAFPPSSHLSDALEHEVGCFVSHACALEGRDTVLCYNLLRGGTRMGDMSSIIGQLKKERDRVEKQLSGLNAALTAFAGAYSNGQPSRKRRMMSAKSRAKIAAAQRRRWAKFRKSKTT